MTPVKSAGELEEVLRTRLQMDFQPGEGGDKLRSRIADHLEDMVSKRIIPEECVIMDLGGWCRGMAANVSFETGTASNDISMMCRRIMAAFLMRPRGLEERASTRREAQVPVSAYLQALGRTPPDVVASIEDEEKVEALKRMALHATLKPSLLDRLKDAKKVVEDAEEKVELIGGFKRLVELD